MNAVYCLEERIFHQILNIIVSLIQIIYLWKEVTRLIYTIELKVIWNEVVYSNELALLKFLKRPLSSSGDRTDREPISLNKAKKVYCKSSLSVEAQNLNVFLGVAHSISSNKYVCELLVTLDQSRNRSVLVLMIHFPTDHIRAQNE